MKTSTNTEVHPPYIVSPSRIRDITGIISRSTAYVLERTDSDFPKRVRLSPGSTGWRYSELIAYVERRAEAPARILKSPEAVPKHEA